MSRLTFVDTESTFMTNSAIVAVTVTSAVFFWACSQEQNRQLGQQGVDRFRARFASGEYQRIYDEGDPDLHKATNAADFSRMLETAQRRLGRFQGSVLRTHQENWRLDRGLVMTFIYDTDFVGGKAQEEFTWRVRDGRPILLGYKVTSPVLMSQ